jgi:hypothetical protein
MLVETQVFFKFANQVYCNEIQYTQGHIVIDVRRPTCQTTGRMETGAIKRVTKLKS